MQKHCTFDARPWKIDSDLSLKAIGKSCNGKCPEMGINAELYNFNQQIYYVTSTKREPYCNVK